MKPLTQLGIFLILLMLFGGCYTQLAVVDRQGGDDYRQLEYYDEDEGYIESDTLYGDAPIIQNFYLGSGYGDPYWDDWGFYNHWGVYVGIGAYDPFWYRYPWHWRSWYPVVVASPYWYWYSPYYDPWYWGPVHYGSKYYGKRPFERRSPFTSGNRRIVRSGSGATGEGAVQSGSSRRIVRRADQSSISNQSGNTAQNTRKIRRAGKSGTQLENRSAQKGKTYRRYRPSTTRYTPARRSSRSTPTYRKSSDNSGSSRSIRRSSGSSSGSRSSGSSSGNSGSSGSSSGSRRGSRR
ncbi:MAG: hypothetical protein Kow0037_15900 [Calditrichia bacterium]